MLIFAGTNLIKDDNGQKTWLMCPFLTYIIDILVRKQN